MNAARYFIPSVIGILALVLAFMGHHLWQDLKALSIAGNDNPQWHILQLDNEFANLHASLLEESAKPVPDRSAIRLRTNIALSRVDLVRFGNSGRMFASDPNSVARIKQVESLAQEATRLVDGDLTPADISELFDVVTQARPVIRRLAVDGQHMVAQASADQRKRLAGKLRNTGFVAIFLIGVLGAVLMTLNRLLRIARKQDMALQASSQRLASTIEASLDAIVSIRSTGEIVDFNSAAESIFGWKKQELVGENAEDTLLSGRIEASDPSDASHEGSGLLRYVGRGRVEIIAKRKSGEEFSAEISVTTAEDASDDLVIAYLRDISEQKLSEQALIDAKNHAERTDRAKSQFLTTMSHEMRTPLNGILGVLDLLRATDLSEKQAGYVDVATASSEVLLRHINEGLDIARIEAGSVSLAPSRFNPAEELRQVADVLGALAEEKNLALKVEISPDMACDFVADGARIGQIVMNLVGNAIKFTSQGEIRISLEGTHDGDTTLAKIIVEDTGTGIDEKYIETIFEDFVALSDSQGRMSRSDGLGLSISRKLARLMGGDIVASSKVGVGSTFCLMVPLQGAKDHAHSPAAVQTVTEIQPQTVPKDLNVLIVDDNLVNLSVLGEMLSALGCRVTKASSGPEGRDLSMRHPFDAIFMDINMPDLDGVELTRTIRGQDGPNRTTRIHGITAFGEEEYRNLAKAAGMDGFSTKPIRIDKLAKTLGGWEVAPEPLNESAEEIDTTVFDELCQALGREKFCRSANEFFQQMQEALEEIGNPELPDDEPRVCALLHDLRGAAAIFGLRALADGLDDASVAARNADIVAYRKACRRLGHLAEESQNRLLDLAMGGTGFAAS